MNVTATQLHKFMNQHQKQYSNQQFHEKLQQTYTKIKGDLLYVSLLGYHALNSPQTPLAAKAQVAGALAYFIFPADLVADVLPVVGYGDDFAALLIALKAVQASITPTVAKQAQQQLKRFGIRLTRRELQAIEQKIGIQ